MSPPSFERAVLDALPLAIYTVDLDGRITSTNRASLGASIFDAIADTAPRERIERAMTLLRTGREPRVSWEFADESPDEPRLLLMHVTPLHGDDGTGEHGHVVTG